jgi:hypothetical protein
MKNLAICLSGLHFQENYYHFLNVSVDVNYQEYLKNIKTKIYGYFEKYNIDTFICTQESSQFSELLNAYNPVKYCIETRNHCYKKIRVLQLLIDYIDTSRKRYDLVLLTRFDIYIIKEFTENNLDLNKLNNISTLNDRECDDNLFIFPINYLMTFKNVLEDRIKNYDLADSLHHLKNVFEENFSVNYICNEPGHTAYDLSFFTLRLFKDIQLVMNKYLFSENVVYRGPHNNANIKLYDNIIEFCKNNTTPCDFCWMAYELERENAYFLSFEIYSNRDIDFDFIKLHQPVRFYKTKPIISNTWTKIDLLIEIKEVDDLLCLIFDNFNNSIKILYRQFTCIKSPKGFIVDNIKTPNVYLSNKCIFNKIDEDSFEFIKEPTENMTPFLWCGYNILATKVKTIMKFEICFKTEVPNTEDNFFIKTHAPEAYYNEWLHQCKKDEFVNIEIPLFLCKTEQLIIFIMDRCLKPVHFIIKNVSFVTDDLIYKFITFYTQGEPFDKCIDLTDCVRGYANSIRNYVDSLRLYNAYEFKTNPVTEYLVHEFEHEPSCNHYTHLIGYLRWKPYILLQSLLNSNEGDIIIYRDVNTKKYPQILMDIEDIIKTANFVLKDTDIFIPVEGYPRIKKKQHIKREVFEHFDLYDTENLESYLLNASIIICRKNDKIVKFMKEWLTECSDDNLISSVANPPQLREFGWNTQEQAIMNLLTSKYIKMNIFKNDTFKYSVLDRRLSKGKLKRVMKVAILMAGEMRNFDNNQLLFQNNKYLFELYNCDVFVSTWDKCGYSPDHGTVDPKNYSGNITNEDKIKNAFKNVKNVNIENYDEWFNHQNQECKDLYNNGFFVNNRHVNATVFPQLYKIWDCNRMKKEYEKQNEFEYDLVIRMRSDLCLVEEIPESFLQDFYQPEINPLKNTIVTLNSPKIFYPNRIYDAFFYGDSNSMNKLCDGWLHILDYINHPFDNGLPKVDACRVLYAICVIHNLNVLNLSRCIGEVYRDEPMEQFIAKILHEYN